MKMIYFPLVLFWFICYLSNLTDRIIFPGRKKNFLLLEIKNHNYFKFNGSIIEFSFFSLLLYQKKKRRKTKHKKGSIRIMDGYDFPLLTNFHPIYTSKKKKKYKPIESVYYVMMSDSKKKIFFQFLFFQLMSFYFVLVYLFFFLSQDSKDFFFSKK